MTTLRLYIDWDNFPGNAVDFTHAEDNITAYVQRVRIRVGGQPGDLVARVGTCAITVRNTGREFSPGVPGGPFDGRLLPMKPVKIEADDGVTIWTLFRGFVQSITPAPDPYGERNAVIHCLDWIGVLQAAEIDLPLRQDITARQLITDVVNYALRAPIATGRVDCAATPGAGHSVTLNGTTYTFQTALAAPNDVLIGTGRAARFDSLDNLLAALNGWEGAGARYHLSTLRPAGLRARLNASYAQTVRDSAPVRYYRLGETSGLIAYDLGTNRADAAYTNGVTLGAGGALSGDADPSASFDGVNDYIGLPTLDVRSASFTLEAWINPAAAAPPAIQGVISAQTAPAAGQAVRLIYYNTGQVVVDYYGSLIGTGTGVIPAGAWTHLAYTYDAAADLSTLYVNGEPLAQSTLGPFEGVRPVWTVGALEGGAAGFFKGQIDEVAIYLRPLTSAEVAAHFTAQSVAPGLTLFSTVRGSIGNALPYAASGASLTAAGATLTGGADEPAGMFSYQATSRRYPFAGDAWGEATTATNALSAIQHIAESERGRFYVQRDGTLTFENAEQPFLDRLKPVALNAPTDGPVILADGGLTSAEVFNSVRVQSVPPATTDAGVVAQSRAVVSVPGRWGGLSSDPHGGGQGGFLDAGQVVISLPYIDPDTGRRIGAADLTLPLTPGTDWQASEARDGSYGDYTFADPPVIFFSVAQKASGVDIYIKNTALGTLYVRKLQVRGVKIVRYDPQTVIREDAASIERYGRHTRLIVLPLETDPNFAAAVAEYELSRSALPRYRVRRLGFRAQNVVSGTNVLAVKLGDVVRVHESQTLNPASSPLLRVCGLTYDLGVKHPFSVHLDVEPADETNFGVYTDSASVYDASYYTI